MLKIIFSDFDDTMLHYYSEKNYFDDYKIDILRRVHKRGIKFVIVTGRSVAFFKRFPNLLEVVDYIVSSNGACIYDVVNDCFLFDNNIEEFSLKEIINYAINKKYSFILNCLDKKYEIDKNNYDAYYGLAFDYYCEQIVLKCEQKNVEEAIDYLESVSNIIVNNVTSWKKVCSIDINSKSVSKGNAILYLCNYLGVDYRDTLGFGDGENDISMFNVVGKGVAVENACSKLKRLSYDITLSCEDNGIYKYMKENILK